jgi:hypothetical protein
LVRPLQKNSNVEILIDWLVAINCYSVKQYLRDATASRLRSEWDERMEMKKINAGKLRAIGYNRRERVLRVEFDDGSAIDYRVGLLRPNDSQNGYSVSESQAVTFSK